MGIHASDLRRQYGSTVAYYAGLYDHSRDVDHVLGVALFCGLGALLGRLADSQDGVIAASNGIAVPLLFLSETFVPPSMLPEWFVPLMELSPLARTPSPDGLRGAESL